MKNTEEQTYKGKITYNGKNTNKWKKINSITMIYHNAVVELVLNNEIWTPEMYYQLPKPIVSNLRISRMYSQVDKEKKKAPKFFCKKNVISFIETHKKITKIKKI